MSRHRQADPCTNTSPGRRCGQPAIAALTLHVAGDTLTPPTPLPMCATHLTTTILRAGATATDIAQIISDIGARNAHKVLEEQHQERRPR